METFRHSDAKVLLDVSKHLLIFYRTGVDYVIFFRLLSHAICDYSPQKVVDILNRSAYNVVSSDDSSIPKCSCEYLHRKCLIMKASAEIGKSGSHRTLKLYRRLFS